MPRIGAAVERDEDEEQQLTSAQEQSRLNLRLQALKAEQDLISHENKLSRDRALPCE